MQAPHGIARRIVGYHRDEIGDWVAELECGHGQHVRHDPPWQVREWVTTEEGRAQHLGTTLDCVRCVEPTSGRGREPPVRHETRDPDFEARVRAASSASASWRRWARRSSVSHPVRSRSRSRTATELTQQHGYLHAGVMTSVADSACGYAALSLTEADVGVLSVEFKVNMLAPAMGDRFVATGRVVRAGRTLTVCSAEVTTERDGATVVVLLMQATMMSVRGREGVAD